MDQSVYLQLARHLVALRNGFPWSDDGAELCQLAKRFTREVNELPAQQRLTNETLSTEVE